MIFHTRYPFPFPHKFSWLIDNPLRRWIISPRKLVKRLSLTGAEKILEIGPGSGYFSLALADHTPGGSLDLFDIQFQMLEKARKKLESKGYSHIKYTVGNAGGKLPYPEDNFDLVLLVSVLGEVKELHHCLKSIYRVLKPGGRLVFHESIPDPDMINFNKLQPMVLEHGFVFVNKWGPKWNYTAEYAKVS